MDSSDKQLSAKSASVFIPPPALQKLRTQNEQLRSELRSLSVRLDELLSSSSKKKVDQSSLRSKEILNAKAQLEQYKSSLKDLKRRQVQHQSPTKMTDLHSHLTDLQQAIKSKELSIKNLKRLENERGVALNSISADSTQFTELKTATEDYRRRVKMASEIEEEVKRGEEAHRHVTEKVVLLEGRYKELVGQGGVDEADDEPKPIPVASQDLVQIKAKVEQLEKKKAGNQSNFQKSFQSAESQLELLEKQLKESHATLKEKEQKFRILTLKLNELIRNVKILQRKNENTKLTLKGEKEAEMSKDESTSFITQPMSGGHFIAEGQESPGNP